MKTIMKTIILSLAILFAVNFKAQTTDKKWGIGINTGMEQYNGDFGNGFYNINPYYGFGGISINRNLNDHFDLTLNTTLGEIGYIENSSNKFRYSLFQFNVNVKYNFFKYDDVKLRPFVFAGLGYMRFSDKRSNRKFDNMQLPDFGLGLTYKVTPIVSIVFQETFIYSDYDNIEYETGNANDFYVQHSIGVVFNLGKSKDTDNDGVSDKKDKCPEVSGLIAFHGCPDTDGDGVTDAEDKCPAIKGLKEFHGCPDTDGDGVTDADDKCPAIKGLKEFNGCPDTDGDGVTDAEDKCPTIKGLKEFNGCVDTDGDGVSDIEDECPAIKGLKKFNGCPDTDNDGVTDEKDACPEVAGILKNKGCPEVKEETKKMLEKALHGVKFQSGKDVITKSSYGILNNVVSMLNANQAYNLKINGHTDSQGKDEQNLALSTSRANAVKNYLIKEGITKNRLVSKGFGETIPVADNKTSKGRAENRRVELVIVF